MNSINVGDLSSQPLPLSVHPGTQIPGSEHSMENTDWGSDSVVRLLARHTQNPGFHPSGMGIPIPEMRLGSQKHQKFKVLRDDTRSLKLAWAT